MPKKDYDKWCKGKEGVDHTPEPTTRVLGTMTTCGLRGGAWVCVHAVSCSVCARVLKYEWQMHKEDCPNYEEVGAEGAVEETHASMGEG